ncbi:MAG: response regulator [Bacteroidota bacterium]|nr:response regulator [Bacteroidota bacterium]
MGLFDKIFGKGLEVKPGTKPKEGVYKNISLFIVDDNEAFMYLIESHLISKEEEGSINAHFSISKYTNGEECILALDQKPDIILLDYYLNNDDVSLMNGDEVFKKILEINPNQKVVMLSGQEESTLVHSLIKQGLREYIMKDEEMFENLQSILLEVYNSK